MFTDINICAGGSWSYLVPLSQNKTLCDLLSRPKQKFSAGQSKEGWGPGRSLPWVPAPWRQGEQRLGSHPLGSQDHRDLSGFAIPLKWCGFLLFQKTCWGEIEGIVETAIGGLHRHRKWQVCRNSGLLEGNLLWFLFPNSLRNCQAWVRCLFWALLCKQAHLRVLFSSLIWNLPAANFISENHILILDIDIEKCSFRLWLLGYGDI